MFGEIIQINAKYKSFIEEICDYFSLDKTVYDLKAIPSIKLFFNLHHTHRYLFRTRPHGEILEGCFIECETGNLQEWTFDTPPIPPFESEIYSGKLIAFHAGAVLKNSSAFLIMGKQASGKTTSVTRLVNEYECELITDETVLISKNTNIVHPFPRMILPRKNENGKIVKGVARADKHVRKIASKIAQVKEIFILNPSNENKITKLNSMNSCYHILEYFQYSGTSIRDSLKTISILSNCDTYLIEYDSSEFENLEMSIEKISKMIDN